MASLVQKLDKKNLLNPPKWLPDNVMYEVYMGSVAYGVSSDTSDSDIYGFAIPPKYYVFPHLNGEIEGFGTKGLRFDQYQDHHINEPDSGNQYDITIFNIVKYFDLCMDNNPNMIDSLFVPANCIAHITHVGQLIRDNRKEFLHKGSYHKFRGYAYSQLHKMKVKSPEMGSKRAANIEEFGFDTKYAYHLVRLADEAEQILSTGDLDLQRNKEHLKAIRRGEISEQEIRDWFSDKERHLQRLYESSTLRYAPDEDKIKQLLLQCLEAHYGSLDKCVSVPDLAEKTLSQIEDLINNYRTLEKHNV